MARRSKNIHNILGNFASGLHFAIPHKEHEKQPPLQRKISRRAIREEEVSANAADHLWEKGRKVGKIREKAVNEKLEPSKGKWVHDRIGSIACSVCGQRESGNSLPKTLRCACDNPVALFNSVHRSTNTRRSFFGLIIAIFTSILANPCLRLFDSGRQTEAQRLELQRHSEATTKWRHAFYKWLTENEWRLNRRLSEDEMWILYIGTAFGGRRGLQIEMDGLGLREIYDQDGKPV